MQRVGILKTSLISGVFPPIGYGRSYTKRPMKHPSNFVKKKNINWEYNKDNCESVASFKIVSFNLLAPCYKRLQGTKDDSTGHRLRESTNNSLWRERADKTLRFFQNHLLGKPDESGNRKAKASIIALQEYWLNCDYTDLFDHDFTSLGYEVRHLQRSGKKTDAVALVVNIEMFDILGSENIHLCTIGDRVALLLWLRHKETDKHILVANTHLSFPHHAWDRMNQMQQMKKLINCIESFAERHSIKIATRIVLGDFNVESNSPVCDHLRESGYFSCFEVSPPANLTLTTVTTDSQHSNNHQYHNSKHHHHPPHSHQHHTSNSHSDFNSNIIVSSRGGSTSPSPPPTSPFDMAVHLHNINATAAATKFVSHRTHKHEDLGVDHIFIKPEVDEYAATREIWNLFASEIIPASPNSIETSNQQDTTNQKYESDKNGEPFPPQDVTEDSSSISNSTPNMGIYVDESTVYPTEVSAADWFEGFSVISDHRPVGSTIIFGRRVG